MTFIQYIIVVILTLEVVVKIGTIGDQRQPVTRSDAIVQLIASTALIIGIVWFW